MEGKFNMNEVMRISIIESVINKNRTQKEAARALNISERQVRNIVKRFREEGYEGIKHKNKFHKPANAFSDDFIKRIVELKLSNDYIATNFCHFRDLLNER